MPVARRLPARCSENPLVLVSCAAALLACAQPAADAQMQHLVPYRLTDNGPGEFTYVTGGDTSELGYEVARSAPEGPFANAHVFLNGETRLSLSNVNTPYTFARHVGRVGPRFLVSETASTAQPANNENTAVNLILHDGQTGTRVTDNPAGFRSTPHVFGDRLLFTTGRWSSSQSSRPVQQDLFAYRPTGSINLTNNPPDVVAAPVDGAVAIGNRVVVANRTFVPGTINWGKVDLLIAPTDGAAPTNISNNPDGYVSELGSFRGPDDVFFVTRDGFNPTLRSDVLHFNGATTTNLTNNPAQVHSGVAADAGADLIVGKANGTFRPQVDLFRYRAGALTNMSNNPTRVDSRVVATFGTDVLFRTWDYEDQYALYLNDGHSTTALVRPGEGAGFVRRVGTQYLLRTTRDLWAHDGAGSINLTNHPEGVRFSAGVITDFRNGIQFTMVDERAGPLSHQSISNIVVYAGALHRVSNNTTPGTRSHSGNLVDAGSEWFFPTTASSSANTERRDIMVYDGQSTRNVTRVADNQFADFRGRIGGDPLIGLQDLRNGTGNQTYDLVRYGPAGSLSLTQNPPGVRSTLLDVRGERAFWYNAPVAVAGPISFLSGDGSSAPTPFFDPPPDQTFRRAPGFDTIAFFIAEGGTGAQRSSNIWVYVDGGLRQLTDNGPGWLARVYLWEPNAWFPEPLFADMRIIELTTVAGDRRDVIVVRVPEPASAVAVAGPLLFAGRRRQGARPRRNSK